MRRIEGIPLPNETATYISVPTREEAEQLEDFLFAKGIRWHGRRSTTDLTPRRVLDDWYRTDFNACIVLRPNSSGTWVELSGMGRTTDTITLKEFLSMQTNLRRK